MKLWLVSTPDLVPGWAMIVTANDSVAAAYRAAGQRGTAGMELQVDQLIPEEIEGPGRVVKELEGMG